VPDPTAHADAARPKLSICIATFKRARFIGETLASILGQLQPGVEVVVVDGASPDDTAEVVARQAAGNPAVRYHREATNSGVDADYDKAVGYARGEYCWLMTDDDVLVPGAVARVLDAVADGPDLVVVNAESRTPDLERIVDARIIAQAQDQVYGPEEREAFFVAAANPLSFIGAVVIRREAWLARDRASYYGTLFIHVGVIFQAPSLGRVRVLGEPLIRIRWGNAMWTARSFEIWMFKWPQLIWSFDAFPERARAAICPREPWRNLRMLGLHRALGGYSAAEYRKFVEPRAGVRFRVAARAVAAVPTAFANVLASAYCLLVARTARRELYDLAHGDNSTWLARRAARARGL
jgi:glycosyltransferase involved in cell wall biosynthesis